MMFDAFPGFFLPDLSDKKFEKGFTILKNVPYRWMGLQWSIHVGKFSTSLPKISWNNEVTYTFTKDIMVEKGLKDWKNSKKSTFARYLVSNSRKVFSPLEISEGLSEDGRRFASLGPDLREAYQNNFDRPDKELMVGTVPVPLWTLQKSTPDDRTDLYARHVIGGGRKVVGGLGFCVAVAPLQRAQITQWTYFHPWLDQTQNNMKYMMISYDGIPQGFDVDNKAVEYVKNSLAPAARTQHGLPNFCSEAWWIGYEMARRMM